MSRINPAPIGMAMILGRYRSKESLLALFEGLGGIKVELSLSKDSDEEGSKDTVEEGSGSV